MKFSHQFPSPGVTSGIVAARNESRRVAVIEFPPVQSFLEKRSQPAPTYENGRMAVFAENMDRFIEYDNVWAR